MTVVAVRQWWDQQDGETDQHHRWFLIYRDMGPTRSLLKTQRKIREAEPEKKAKESKNIAGFMGKIASDWKWRERAQAYDIHQLRTHGHRVATVYVDALEKMAKKVRRAIIRSDVTELEWKRILETMTFIANQLHRASEAQQPSSVSGPVPVVRPSLPGPGPAAGNGNGIAQ